MRTTFENVGTELVTDVLIDVGQVHTTFGRARGLDSHFGEPEDLRSETTAKVDLINVFNTRGLRIRDFTFPNRSVPGPSLSEFRERNSHFNFTLSLKRTFGGTEAAAPGAAGGGVASPG